jgi:hypothetical protein
MKWKSTFLFLLTGVISLSTSAQQKLVDNSQENNSPANGPAYLVAKADDSRIMYRGDKTIYWYDLASGAETTSNFTSNPRDWDVFGETIFAIDEISVDNKTDLVFAHIDDISITELDYYSQGSNFPRIMGIDLKGNFYGSGKIASSNVGRDIIRLSADRTTVTGIADNVTDGNDLINKGKYKLQMVGFADDKILIKSFRGSTTDEEYFVWDDGDQTYTQITDVDNTDADGKNDEEWPLAVPYSSASIAFLYKFEGNSSGIYTTDGTSPGTSKIADVSTFHKTALAATSNRILWADTDGGDEELYVYDGTSTSKIDLNTTGSSSPREFVANGDQVAFIANGGDGYEVYIYNGTSASKLVDLATGVDAITSYNAYYKRTIWKVGNGFVFVGNAGSEDHFYYTDGVNVVLLNNGDTYDGYFTSQQLTTYVTSEYFYHTDNDKDIFRTPIPDNIYVSSVWATGSVPPASGTLQDVYINDNLTLASSEVLTVRSLQISEGNTITVASGGTLVIKEELFNKGSITVASGGTLITYDGKYSAGNDITFERNRSFGEGRYSMVGIPVATANGSDLRTQWIYSYNESNDGWNDATSATLVPGQGYASAGKQNMSFTGIPNKGEVTYNAVVNGNGFNLVANPYAAALDVSKFLTAQTNITGTIYLWDDGGSNAGQRASDDYVAVNGAGLDNDNYTSGGGGNSYNNHIGSMQGFFVQATNSTAIKFTEDMRVDGSNADPNYFRTANESLPYVKLKLFGEDGVVKVATIGWADNADDNQINTYYDSKIFNDEAPFALFTLKDQQSLVIQGITESKEELQLGLHIDIAGQYQFSLDNEAFSDRALYLLDGMNGNIIDLSQGSYHFNADQGQNLGRFKLMTRPLDILSVQPQMTKIYVFDGKLYIKRTEPTTLRVYSLSGQRVMEYHSKGSEVLDLSGLLQNGLYMLTDGKTSRKFVIK